MLLPLKIYGNSSKDFFIFYGFWGGFPGGPVVKNLPASAPDTGDLVSILESEESME